MTSVGEPERENDTEEEDEDDDVLEDMPPPSSYSNRGQRASVSAEAYGAWNQQGVAFVPPVHSKSEVVKERIKLALSNSFLFAEMEEDAKGQVLDAFKEERMAAGTLVIQQFSSDADRLFLVDEGTLSVYKKKEPKEDGHGAKVFEYNNKGVFGELALLYSCPRAATVIADTESLLWSIDRETFNHLIKDAAKNTRARREEFLGKVDVLKTLTFEERAKVADATYTRRYNLGDTIIEEGAVGSDFYIVEKGEASASKKGAEVMKYGPTDYFGELSLLEDQPRAATVTALTDVTCVILDRAAFKRLLGPLDQILKERAAEMY
mmetsp:Transcript_53549/g.148886  ORF Transcript_53549/g.148886 Transcript_53549/m.148886 type:complete len:321 (+) Transcript_53549:90-1052(+)